MTPTPEQIAIVEAACSTSDSLLISALAGAAKTTTLDLICQALPIQPILSLAFNKRIADEMAKRLPGHVSARTLNSIGHRVWAQATGRRLVVDTKKSYNILKEVLNELPRGEQSRAARELFSETLRAVSTAKLNGYIPEGKFPNAKRLISADDFFFELDEDLDREIVDAVLTRSIRAAYEGAIDFDDQIYMPTLFGGTFPRFPLIMVDEAQDLSPLNHAMLDRLVTGRLIAVGDKHQSIYGFRGADTASMARLAERFNMREMVLSTSFRCPSEIVLLARKHAPHMQWWIEGGSVHALTTWSQADIPDGSAIICRNNAPLFQCALALLSRGRGVKLVGTDLGPGLLRTLRRLGPETLTQKETTNAIDRWEAERLTKTRAKGSVADKADCLRVFASFGDTLGAAIAYADHLFASSGPIQLLSGHKSKGLEWDTVFHLDPWRIPSKWAESPTDHEQERNLDYVITTRAKRELVFVDLEGLK